MNKGLETYNENIYFASLWTGYMEILLDCNIITCISLCCHNILHNQLNYTILLTNKLVILTYPLRTAIWIEVEEVVPEDRQQYEIFVMF